MNMNPLWYELIERAKNFRINFKSFEKQAIENAIFYILGNFSCGEILDQNNPPKAGMQIGRSV